MDRFLINGEENKDYLLKFYLILGIIGVIKLKNN